MQHVQLLPIKAIPACHIFRLDALSTVYKSVNLQLNASLCLPLYTSANKWSYNVLSD